MLSGNLAIMNHDRRETLFGLEALLPAFFADQNDGDSSERK